MHIHSHADIHRDYVHACLFGHQADCSLFPAQVLGHDGRDLLPALGYALRDHAVVRTEHDNRTLPDLRLRAALDTRELDDCIL